MEQEYLSKKMMDGMKGYLCLGILVHHIQLFSGVFSNTYFGHFINRLGGWAVAVFFFISGYGLFTSYEKKGNNYVKEFPRKRLLPFYLSYFLFVAMYCCVMHQSVTLMSVLQSLTFGGTIVSFGWFFQYIGIYYLLFFVSFRLFEKKAGTFFYAAALVCFSILCFFLQLRYMCFVPFLAGVLLALKKSAFDQFIRKTYLICLVCSFAVFFAVYLLYIESFIFARFPIHPYLWELSLTISDLAIILFAVSFCFWTRKLPMVANPISEWFSKYSMEIYACQGIVLYLAYPLVGRIILYIGVCLAGTILMAVIMHTLIRMVTDRIKG